MNPRTTKPGYATRRARTIAAVAVVVVTGVAGTPAALATTPEGQVEETSAEVAAADTELEEPAVEEPVVAETAAEQPVADAAVEELAAEEPVELVAELAAEEPAPVEEPADSPSAPGPTASIGTSSPREHEEVAQSHDSIRAQAVATSDGDVVVTWTQDMFYAGDPAWVEMTGPNGYNETQDVSANGIAGYTATFPDVPPGTYSIFIYSIFSTGYAQVTVPTRAPSAPQSLAVSVQDQDATFSWTAPESPGTSEITDYRVALDGDEGTLVPAGQTTHSWQGLTPGRHTASVVAVSADGSSLAATYEFEVRGAPGAPTDVGATQDGDGTVTVTWSTPADLGYPGVSRYAVWVEGDAGEPEYVDAQLNTVTLSDVSPGLRTVNVVAENKYTKSATASATVEVKAAPSAPVALAVDRTARGTVVVTWDEPTDPGYPAVTGYSVRLDGQPVQLVGGKERAATLTGLAVGQHSIDVIAVNKYGSSPAASTTFTMPDVPVAPLEVGAVQTGPASVLVSWAYADDVDLSLVTGYRVTATPNLLAGVLGRGLAAATTETLSELVDANQSSFEFTDLQPGVEYTFTVVTVTDQGDGDPGTAQEDLDAWELPTAPRSFSVAQTGPGQVTIRFDAPEDEGTSPVIGYLLGIGAGESGGVEELDADIREVVLDDLTPGTYTFGITAVNEQGQGDTAVLELVVKADTVPPVDTPVVANAPVRTLDTNAVKAEVTTTATPAALARTGNEAGALALTGVLLLGLGGAAIATGRRRPATRG